MEKFSSKRMQSVRGDQELETDSPTGSRLPTSVEAIAAIRNHQQMSILGDFSAF